MVSVKSPGAVFVHCKVCPISCHVRFHDFEYLSGLNCTGMGVPIGLPSASNIESFALFSVAIMFETLLDVPAQRSTVSPASDRLCPLHPARSRFAARPAAAFRHSWIPQPQEGMVAAAIQRRQSQNPRWAASSEAEASSRTTAQRTRRLVLEAVSLGKGSFVQPGDLPRVPQDLP